MHRPEPAAGAAGLPDGQGPRAVRRQRDDDGRQRSAGGERPPKRDEHRSLPQRRRRPLFRRALDRQLARVVAEASRRRGELDSRQVARPIEPQRDPLVAALRAAGQPARIAVAIERQRQPIGGVGRVRAEVRRAEAVPAGGWRRARVFRFAAHPQLKRHDIVGPKGLRGLERLRANRGRRIDARGGVRVIARVDEDVAHADRPQQVERVADPIEIVERRCGAAEEFLQRRAVAAVAVHDRMAVRQGGVLIGQRRRDRPLDDREFDRRARRLFGEPAIGAAIAGPAAVIERRHRERRRPALGDNRCAERGDRGEASAPRQARQQSRGADGRQHAERHQHNDTQPRRHAQTIHPGDDPYEPGVRTGRQEAMRPGRGFGTEREHERRRGQRAVEDRGAAARAARPQGGRRADGRHETWKQLALGKDVAVQQPAPQPHGRRHGDVRADVGAEHRPVLGRPPESVLMAHRQVGERHGADEHQNDRRRRGERGERAHPIRA